MLKTPVKEGYTFKGWYKDPEFNNKITKIHNINENLNLYAKWEANSYKANFNLNNGYIPNANPVTITFVCSQSNQYEEQLYPGEKLQYRDCTQKNKYFVGWYLGSKYGTYFDFSESIYEDITLYAKWLDSSDIDEGYYKIYFKDIDPTLHTSADDPLILTSGQDIKAMYSYLTAAYSGTYYIYIKHGEDEYGNFGNVVYYTLQGEKEIGVSIVKNKYTIIKLEMNAGQTVKIRFWYPCYMYFEGFHSIEKNKSDIELQTVYVYNSAVNLPTPILEGFEFIGWYYNDLKVENGIWKIANDCVLIAKFQKISS